MGELLVDDQVLAPTLERAGAHVRREYPGESLAVLQLVPDVCFPQRTATSSDLDMTAAAGGPDT